VRHPPTTYSYTTNTATVTDPQSKQRKSVTDGAGRLSSIYEPDPTNNNNLTLQTSYTYSVLDELTQVSQGSQTRTYAYDALGRLNSATTPEGGTVCFGTYSGSTCQSNGYDSFNNLLYRTDARGVVTNYIYDSLNRLLGVTYPTVPNGVRTMPNVCETTGSSSNNANVCFTYGTSAASYNNGRVSTMNDGLGSETYTYNNLVQLTQLQKVISSTTYTTGYQYNVANELTQITYPSSRVVQQYVDPIGRVCAIATSTTSCSAFTGPFATGFAYSTANQVTGFKYGNNVYASFGFSSDRLQLNCLDYSTTNRSSCAHDSTTKFGLNYSYYSAPSNNGQISSITDSMDGGRTITYTYDSLYRMTKAVTTGSTNYPAWGLSEAYDRYSNRSAQSIYSGCTGITCPTNSVTVSATTNQITGSPYLYDASGDMTNDGVNTLTYDGEARAVAASGSLGSGTYTVDGNGLRVKKVAGSTTTVYIFSGSKVIAEYQNGAAPSAPTTEYIYAGGTLIAKINSSGTNYYHQDHLSNRLVTNSSGSTVAQLGHFPFGESWYNATSDRLMFTTYERDSESGNDYAMARYHVSRLGRLSSPDPLAGSIIDPQSLNRYAYSVNDPANVTDPSGAFPWTCESAQTPPKDEPQQTSGTGHSDEGPDPDADPPPQQTGCRRPTDVFGDSNGNASLDGGYSMDDSGDLPNGGFQVGGGDVASQIAMMSVRANPVYELDWAGGDAGIVLTLVSSNPGILFDPFGFPGDGDGGPGGDQTKSNYRLVATSDCATSTGREINYQIETTNGNSVPGYYVIQHESNASRTGNTDFGQQTSFQDNSQFVDTLRPGTTQFFSGPDDSKQTFFISPMSQAESPKNMVPVLVRDSAGHDYSELGAWISLSQVLVNGKPAPSLAPCKHP
jgi:RHS repeat-associated protein